MGEVVKSYYEAKLEQYIEEKGKEGGITGEDYEAGVLREFVEWLHKEGLRRAEKDPEGDRD